MKFSLKQLVWFVTIAAVLCGVVGYSYTRIQNERQRAVLAKKEAERAQQIASEQVNIAMKARLEAHSIPHRLTPQSRKQTDYDYSIMHWNVESGGNDPATIAEQLVELGHYDIIGLSEVADPMFYAIAMMDKWPGHYLYIPGLTGGNDRLMLFFDSFKFELVETANMHEANGVLLNKGRHRAPLYVRLKDKRNYHEFIVILNHLARGDAEFRTQQAKGLREWARTKSEPIIAIGDFNFDYDFNTKKGNAGFDEFLEDGVWKWIKPDPMIDTNWSDDGKGGDRYPDSILDFNFVAGAAKDWKAECRVIVRDGDFPDDNKTSDHRPVELILKK